MDVDDDLLRAVERVTTLTRFIEEALAAALAAKPARAKPFRLRWKPHRGRLRPGVDLVDRDALFEAREGRR